MACTPGDGREDDTSAGPGIDSLSQGDASASGTSDVTTTDPPATSNVASDDGMTTVSVDDDDTSSTPKFDMMPWMDVTIPEEGCRKVDFLFVIDNSGSMADEQDNLTASFPGFISGIQSALEQVDEYHVGVVTTDAYSPNNAVPGCNVLGGLVTKTGGSNSSNATCGPYAAGTNYMTEIDNLDVAFACAADTGTSGNGYELTMDAMKNVVNGVHAGPGQCNEGFLRDDALLVLVLITDEYDGQGDPEGQASSGTPADWYNAVVTAKLGIPENAVALGLLNYAGGPCPPASTVYDGVNMVNFVNMFGANGFLGGICEPDYGPVFAQAVGIIEEACNNFVPPG
ncbi:hypothetical protein [Paraliomyxa miuraensis]|uniref:hypothetical protein n=1 Tax=Paraliomyxa miuraensis TaxID=376150 RepID=UPI00225C345C|nr:hypothetical protein [Paraliomyxa miuraensis]MCX4240624.1 hypothetical protein [Paraliomyxa miuraensis]